MQEYKSGPTMHCNFMFIMILSSHSSDDEDEGLVAERMCVQHHVCIQIYFEHSLSVSLTQGESCLPSAATSVKNSGSPSTRCPPRSKLRSPATPSSPCAPRPPRSFSEFPVPERVSLSKPSVVSLPAEETDPLLDQPGSTKAPAGGAGVRGAYCLNNESFR